MTTLADRVVLLRKLVWFGATAFDPHEPPVGSLQDPNMRQIGLEITQPCRGRDDMCELHSIYWFTKNNTRYTGDITFKDTFQSAWRTLQYGGGDCLPLSTLVLCLNRKRAEGTFVPLSEIEEGDLIMADGDWTRVEKSWFTGRKPILAFELSNATVLRCSPEHRLLTLDGHERRAAHVEVGEHLLTPRREISLGYGSIIPVSPGGARVVAIRREPGAQLCMDITTEAGHFWLPESDTLVHNCDDHAVQNAVLAMVNGFETRFRITSNTGSSWDHIYLQAGVPKTQPRRWVTLDTTLPGRDRFDVQPPFAKKEDFPVTEPRR